MRGSWWSAVAEGHGDRPRKAQVVTRPSCTHSGACVTLPCCPPREGDRSQSSTGSCMREAQEQRTGVHLWKCFHRVSKLISHTARAQTRCHEAFFIKSAYFWTHCCWSDCHWQGQAETEWSSSGHRWTPTWPTLAAEPATLGSFTDNAEKRFP